MATTQYVGSCGHLPRSFLWYVQVKRFDCSAQALPNLWHMSVLQHLQYVLEGLSAYQHKIHEKISKYPNASSSWNPPSNALLQPVATFSDRPKKLSVDGMTSNSSYQHRQKASQMVRPAYNNIKTKWQASTRHWSNSPQVHQWSNQSPLWRVHWCVGISPCDQG